MKTKRTLIAVMILSMALLTACSTKKSADNSATSLDDLYQQENQVFADHEDVWNKVFGMMNGRTADGELLENGDAEPDDLLLLLPL